jgi:hypothetical protein
MGSDMKNPRALFALLVWLVAEAVLQIHGLRFWNEHGGWGGWLWSPVLGIVTVWFWLHTSTAIRWSFGLIASALLLVGPLWQIGAPLVEAAAQWQAEAQAVVLRLQALRNAETELAETQRIYLHNSESRTGWADELETVRGNLRAVRQEIAVLLTAAPAQRTAWLSLAVIWIQLATLITLQVAAVAALGIIRRNRQPAPAVQHATRNATMQRAPVQRETQRSNVATETPATRVAAGHYGPTPTIRGVMDGERLRYPAARRIFDELITAEKLRQEEKGFRLVVG